MKQRGNEPRDGRPGERVRSGGEEDESLSNGREELRCFRFGRSRHGDQPT